MELLDPQWLWALLAVPAAAFLLLWRALRRRSSAARLVGPTLARRLVGTGPVWLQIARGTVLLLALACLALALARPGWDPKPRPVLTSDAGRDVVFVIDVSKSMLAEDISPNRLSRAKLLINDALDAARGDRFGLVAFAGSAAVKSPLTTDYDFVRMAVNDLSPDSVARGGSLIGDAIRTAMNTVFDIDSTEAREDADARGRDIILITDGEDHESFPVEAARAAGKAGIRLIAIGLGSPSGATVPVMNNRGTTAPLTYAGEPVRSKLDPATLRAMAEATPGGVYLDVRTGTADMDRVYTKLMENAANGSSPGDAKPAERTAMRYTEGFQFLLAAAFALLVLEGLTREA